MAISIYNEFSDYMMFRDIKKVDVIEGEHNNTDIHITEELIIEQFRTIYDFHKKAFGFNGYLRNRLNNNTGKIIEEYKIYNKKLAGDIDNIKRDGPKNPFEELIIKYGKEVINRGEQCIRVAYDSDYIGIIKRSMRRTEICLGNTDFQNIKKRNFIEVVNFESCSYNMVEMDCLCLLNKLKKKGVKLDLQRLVNEFCQVEELEDSSSKFLVALLSYPHEFMKCCSRYREGKKQWSQERFSEKLIKALIQDGDSLL